MSTAQTLLGVLRVILLFGGPVLVLCALLIGAVHLVEKQRSSPAPDPRARMGNPRAAITGIAAGVALWLVWFSWGPGGNIDIVMGIGAVVSAFGVLVWLSIRTRWRWTGPFTVALGGLAGFTTVFAVAGGYTDSTGLWAVGYLMTTIGGVIVLALIAGGIVVVRSDDWTD
ncbi:hypothetical protein [Corynebacterium glyciniphilum]|uniref:hypothetical protein n=1 Tax=Corynebacterium glyciniphilum TaxID=1404244 RepID=UPI00265619C9|nr:hypothetical protein [Corynebacterium glyciniphilum]MDN5683510.1 hypothetical protein [Corynebacterium glyciniphilum]MDN6704554.1 hypothetical protein [Corynebacterium glyciniphilum]